MTHIIDSDVIIDFLKGEQQAVRLLAAIGRRNVSISTVSIAELVDGNINGPDPVGQELGLRRLLAVTRVRIVNRAIGELTGQIRADLRRRKRPVGDRSLDLFVAATALEHGLILVTRNLKDYDDIRGLKLHEWSTENV
jgi:tRNA(fMet)-specific endonuclease VapC